ncbi:hypothetical protein SAMN05216167_105166 [Spirosoma endophyticum]|uniref:Uncharacterized protein n=2 Tax=Spirosoma endophyticum TaxID=662367 RepID=A0A1I1SN24_9BACT|nr:hypothetical protein SAMN05216167_105166 [Spirosoma endophyticum]
MSLTDVANLEDLSPLAEASDAVLLSLQTAAVDCLLSWDRIGRALDMVEIAYYNRINRIDNFLTTTLTNRYGCND